MRVEPPAGDPMRPTATAWDTALRAGSESVVCDLPADAAFARALCARADVVLEGFRPGVATRLGVGPGDVPPTTVYCSITGFGDVPQHRARAGHDLNYLGWAGVLEDTSPGLPPIQIADLAAGALGAVTQVLAALLERAAHRRGTPRRGLDDARVARTGRAPARRRAGGAHADRRARVLPHLRHGGRAPAHRRGTRAEVLPKSVRAHRAPRARRATVRGRPGRPCPRARRRPPRAHPRRLARAFRRRGRLRRPGLDARRRRQPSSALPRWRRRCRWERTPTPGGAN